MGALLAKFRKEKTTYEILEKLETEIKEIQEYSINTQAKQKRFVGNFLVISIGLYIIGFLVFYFVFFPPTWMERITYSVPLLIFPLIIFLLRRLLAWYFQRKLNKNYSKLSELRTEKKKALEKVMDKETYKVAIEILNRFGDKTNGLKSAGAITPRITPSPVALQAPKSATPAKQFAYSISTASQQSQLTHPHLAANQLTPINRRPMSPMTPQTASPVIPGSALFAMQRNAAIQNFQMFRRRTPFPIINQTGRGVVEKMVDYLIGDGPQNRFAMICKDCFAHNGMALQEEYEYATFRCAFCNAFNPSRKARPIAPRLPMASPSPDNVNPEEQKVEEESETKVEDSESTSSAEKISSESENEFERAEILPEEQQPLLSEEIAENIPPYCDEIEEKQETVEKNNETTEKSNEEKKND